MVVSMLVLMFMFMVATIARLLHCVTSMSSVLTMVMVLSFMPSVPTMVMVLTIASLLHCVSIMSSVPTMVFMMFVFVFMMVITRLYRK
jgi:hypothetical protein